METSNLAVLKRDVGLRLKANARQTSEKFTSGASLNVQTGQQPLL